MPFDILLTDVLLPLGLMAWMWFDRDQRKIDWWSKAAICGAVVLLRFQVGRWMMLSYALRYVLVALFLVVAFYSYQRVKDQPAWHDGPGGRLLMRVGMIIAGILIYYNVDIARGHLYTGEPVRLDFPLRAGVYYISEGGDHPVLNGHSDAYHTSYALDIEALNGLGRHSQNFLPADLSQYTIYAANLYSPCDGEVVETAAAISDSPINKPYRGAHIMNRVMLRCDGIYILMGHLQKNSILVHKGDHVQVGQPIGKVGNSGQSRWPHLHIQADATRSGYGDLPILFDEKFLVRNDIVVKP